MRLEKIDKNKKKRICSFLFVVVTIIGIVLFSSYTLYKEKNNTNLNGKILDFANENVELAFTINGEKSREEFPVKSSGYEVSSVTCKNGVTASWNQEKWGLSNIESNGNQKIQCSIDFSISKVLVNYLQDLNSSELVDDETADHNLRYIGKNPSNYVSFNGELWRIIGLINDVADDKGVVEPRVKLIRSESIGTYSWDNKGTGKRSNDWNESVLMNVLNSGVYYNRTSGSCPSGENGATIACDFSNSGLTHEAKRMISKVKWKLGGTGNYNDSSNGLTSHFYEYERGTTKYGSHQTEWLGEVGLIYPSDYGYATSGGATTNRSNCLNKELYGWNDGSYNDCKNSNWLYSNSYQWTISPVSSYSDVIFNVFSTGHLNSNLSYRNSSVRPVIYLNTNLNLKSGIGTSTDPFILDA